MSLSRWTGPLRLRGFRFRDGERVPCVVTAAHVIAEPARRELRSALEDCNATHEGDPARGGLVRRVGHALKALAELLCGGSGRGPNAPEDVTIARERFARRIDGIAARMDARGGHADA